MKKQTVLFLVFAFVLFTSTGIAHATTITYDNFSDLSGFTLNGSTASINSGGPVNFGGQDVLRLTNNLGQGGSAFLSNTVPLEDAGGFNASFSTAFTFQITNPIGISDSDGQGADGIVFVIQTVASNVGGAGGGIGYQGIGNSVGVEFDTWDNGSGDAFNGNHVGIDLNGSVNSVILGTVANRMNNGAVWYGWVDYDGATNELEARISETPGRPLNAFIAFDVDLPAILGTPNAFIGFTSGTGAAGGNHDIRSWQFINSFNPIDEIDGTPVNGIPEPATLMLVSAGLMAGFGSRRRKKA